MRIAQYKIKPKVFYEHSTGHSATRVPHNFLPNLDARSLSFSLSLTVSLRGQSAPITFLVLGHIEHDLRYSTCITRYSPFIIQITRFMCAHDTQKAPSQHTHTNTETRTHTQSHNRMKRTSRNIGAYGIPFRIYLSLSLALCFSLSLSVGLCRPRAHKLHQTRPSSVHTQTHTRRASE